MNGNRNPNGPPKPAAGQAVPVASVDGAQSRKNKNWKLVADPLLQKGVVKVLRYEGVVQGVRIFNAYTRVMLNFFYNCRKKRYIHPLRKFVIQERKSVCGASWIK